MSWTQDQSEAIGLRDHNILVSASAGSGKTAVLVERILSLVTEGLVPLSDFLVVTFTNAAAQEMRDRVAKRLVALRRDNLVARAFLSEQLQQVQQAQISTLHSFCKEVISRHFYMLGIDPNFKIGSQQILELKQTEALQGVFDKYYETPPDHFYDFMSIFSSHRNDEAVKGLIRKIYQFSRAHPYPDIWLDQCLSNYQLTTEGFEQTELAKAIKTHVLKEITAIREMLEEALVLGHSSDGLSAYCETLQGDLADYEILDSLTFNHPWMAFETCIRAMKFERLKTIKKVDKEKLDPVVAERVKALRNTAKDMHKKLVENYFFAPIGAMLEDLAELVPYLDLLIKMVKDFANQYWTLKQDEQMVDFNDLEQLCIQALQSEEVSERYRKQFRYIFVDEYQDSNRVQEEIIRLIQRPNNLFQVGDVKQSIYRFRMAEPALFLKRFHSYTTEGHSKRIDLNRNFRTHPDILSGVNCVFDQLLTVDFGGLDYQEDGRLVAGRTDFQGQSRPRVTLVVKSNPMENAAEAESEGEGPEEVEALTEVEALYQRIQTLLGTDFFDTHTQTTRKFQLSDMVVLMRSIKGKAQVLRDYLTTKGIAVAIDEEDSYFDIVEVATVLNSLRILDNQQQDIPLIGVMRSAMGNFSDEELTLIRQFDKDSFHQAFSSLLATPQDQLSQDLLILKHKVEAFSNLLEGLRAQRHLPISEFVWRVLQETGYWYYVIGLEEGQHRRQHLEVLMEKAHQFEQEKQSGLHHFVAYLDQMQQSKVIYGGKANSTGASASLNVMSIHKSKGLEFPVVFILGASRKFNLQDAKSRVVMHQKYGIGTKWMNPDTRQSRDTLPLVYLKELLIQESVMEEVRILYVALTRAVYHLEVFAEISDLEKSWDQWSRTRTPYQYSKQYRYIDWIMSAIVNEEVCPQGDSRWQIETLFSKENDLMQHKEALATQRRLQWLEGFKRAEPQIWGTQATTLDIYPAKLSVSELKQGQANYEYTPRVSPLTQTFEVVQEGIRRGNAYHTFAEHMPLDDTAAARVVSDLLGKGILSSEDVALLNFDQLEKMRSSTFFERLKASQRVWREHPFVWRKQMTDKEDVLIQGVVDLLFLDSEGLVLLDYKSDRLNRASAFIDRYRNQLLLYKDAIEALLKMPVREIAIYAFEIGQWIPIV